MIRRSTFGVDILGPRSTVCVKKKKEGGPRASCSIGPSSEKPGVAAIQRWLVFDFLPIGICTQRFLILRIHIPNIRKHLYDGAGDSLRQGLRILWFHARSAGHHLYDGTRYWLG